MLQTYLPTSPLTICAGTKAMTQSATPTQIASERTLTGQSSFSRTIWLPRRVDGANVTAKLEDGVLTGPGRGEGYAYDGGRKGRVQGASSST